MPSSETAPSDSHRTRLSWRLAAPSFAASLTLLVVAFMGVASLIATQLEADRALDQVLEADKNSEAVATILMSVRLQLLQHAADGRWADARQLTYLRDRLHDLVMTAQPLYSRDDSDLEGKLEKLDEELGVLVGSVDPERRRATAERIVKEFLVPDLLAIAGQERTDARQDLLAAQAHSRAATTKTVWIMLLLGLVGAIAGAVGGFGVARSLRQRLVELRVPIQSAAGSLDAVVGPVQVRGGAEVEDLEESLNSLAARVTDVVQRLQAAERESLRNDQLAALGQLAAGLAHELRNPLTAIRTLVEAARTGGPAAQLDGRDLEVVDEELTRLDSTLQAFLDYARPPRLERHTIDLHDVIDRTILLLKPRAELQSVLLNAALPDEALSLSADPEQLRQVLLNLLLNALDAVGSGGRIDVTAAADPEQRQIVLQIADNGPGISPNIRDRLFEPFVSSKESGTGLGLTICRRIVENHGGTLTAGNRDGGGAVFTIRLPAEARAAVEHSADRGQSCDPRPAPIATDGQASAPHFISNS